MMKYLVWMAVWVVSQRLMMFIGIIDDKSLLSSIGSAIFSVIAVLFARESKFVLTVATILIAVWVINSLGNGEIINGIVGGVMNAWLIIMAVKGKET